MFRHEGGRLGGRLEAAVIGSSGSGWQARQHAALSRPACRRRKGGRQASRQAPFRRQAGMHLAGLPTGHGVAGVAVATPGDGVGA